MLGDGGIGKTTLIRILAGQLIPNLGNYEQETTWDIVLEHFKGHEVQSYLKKMKKQSFAYKVQDITPTPEIGNKKVSEVLKHANVDKELIEDMELEKCASRKLSQISGGELQRLAIAVTVSKDADNKMDKLL